MNNSVYTYTIVTFVGGVTATVYRNGSYVESYLVQIGTLEYLFKKSTKWAETRIALMKRYEVFDKEPK